VALITGGSRGLGFLLAREFAREGCSIVICARDDRELSRAAQALANRGAEVLPIRCDVTDREQVDRLVADSSRQFGRIDILVNNAGIIQVGPLDTMTVDDFRNAMDVMYWGVLYPTLAVLPQMRRRRQGRIVNITSIAGKVSVPHLLPYSSAKFAAVGLSEGLRAELANDGIKVVTVVPGLMRTGSHLNARFKGRAGHEFTWFSLGASLPGISMDAERAARHIVSATKRGEAERVLTIPALLLDRFHGLLPGTTAQIMGLVNAFLPGPDGMGTGAVGGRVAEEMAPLPLLKVVTGMGRRAADRFNQHPGPSIPVEAAGWR
jgi:NAD(P)-dependent dehydrogenase (short-subunit alcohol dehydrogenase family)